MNESGSALHGQGSFASLGPNGIDLFFYLLNFLLVSASFVVRDLCFKLLNLLGVLPVVAREKERKTHVVSRRPRKDLSKGSRKRYDRTYLLRVTSSC